MHESLKAGPPTIVIRDDQAAFYQDIVDGRHASGPRGRLVFCVSTDDLDEGKGDPYVALGLAKYLLELGWGVSLWPRSRWHETPSPAPTVAIVMVESFIPGMLPSSTAAIAWVRNWASAWAALPYLNEFDGIWSSSHASAALLDAHYGGEVAVVPIGVDLELFSQEPVVPRTMSVITTANFWGAERGIQTALTDLSKITPVTWFGSNGEHLVRSPSIHHADRVSFFGLASIYRQSLLVVDDLIAAAREHGNHNSRLYEAIACGAVPITNTSAGLDELGLDEVPHYADATSLATAATRLLSDPAALGALAERLRRIVTERHSYRTRAQEVSPLLDAAVARSAARGERPALLRWSTAERRKLHEAETLRDGHLITVRRLERDLVRAEQELADLRVSRESIESELTKLQNSRTQRLARTVGAALSPFGRLLGRARH